MTCKCNADIMGSGSIVVRTCFMKVFFYFSVEVCDKVRRESITLYCLFNYEYV
jgi:hypothetical protein